MERGISDWGNGPLYGLSPSPGKSRDSAGLCCINKPSRPNKKILSPTIPSLLPGLCTVVGDVTSHFVSIGSNEILDPAWSANSVIVVSLPPPAF